MVITRASHAHHTNGHPWQGYPDLVQHRLHLGAHSHTSKCSLLGQQCRLARWTCICAFVPCTYVVCSGVLSRSARFFSVLFLSGVSLPYRARGKSGAVKVGGRRQSAGGLVRVFTRKSSWRRRMRPIRPVLPEETILKKMKSNTSG